MPYKDEAHVAQQQRTYVPAAGHDFALPLYDPFVRLFGGDRIRNELVEQAALAPRQRILDIGCGTGTLVVLLKQRDPTLEVVGLDPDPRALERADRKARRSGLTVQLQRGFADALPYEAASFDRVFSSYMLHHLSSEEKARTLGEAKRVLKPSGSLHLLDFTSHHEGVHGRLQRLFRASASAREPMSDDIGALLSAAGFTHVEVRSRHALLGQPVVAYHATFT